MNKVWVLLAIAGLLLLWSFVRERFEATASIKKPPYDEAETARIRNMVSKADLDAIRAEMKAQYGDFATDERLDMMVGGLPSTIVAHFFQNVYSTASSPITDFNIDMFLEKPPLSDAPPRQREMAKRLLKSYFIDQSGVGTSMNTGYAAALADLGQNPGYLNTPTTPGGSAGAAVVGSTPATGVGSSAATMSGTTTGGSSTSSMGPNSGGTGASGQRVFGPVFVGRGEGGNPDGGDSSKTNKYPELMGGRGGAAPSTKVDGAGIVSPSKNWLLTTDGSLPSMDSLGATEMSKYFPTSRTPGDMDLVPDPYRLSRNFSTSSYSSKTEPAPFLTDFSAFLK
jgi:hypothetical protein